MPSVPPCLLLLLLATASPSAAGPSSTIFGKDDRQDYYEIDDPDIRALADSTVALIHEGHIEQGRVWVDTPTAGETYGHFVPIGEDWGLADTGTLGERYGLCEGERFYDQPLDADCSGALVGPDLVLTASHCVPSQEECKGEKFVFGYSIKEPGAMPGVIASNDVYGCAKLEAHGEPLLNHVAPGFMLQEGPVTLPIGVGADWALIRLDRPVTGHQPLRLDRSGALRKGTRVFVLGYPSRLPLKAAGLSGHARVQDTGLGDVFWTNLDTFHGNSGSPVFDAESKRVIGLLTHGLDRDYDNSNLPSWMQWRQDPHPLRPGDGCFITHVASADGSTEGVTKIGVLADRVPEPDDAETPEADAPLESAAEPSPQ